MQAAQAIFHYEDPIAYLNDELRERQRRNPRFSMRAWARQLGYQNPSLLFQVLKGERRLKMDLANKLASNLNLKGKSQRYFELIVLAGMSETETEKRVLEEMIQSLRPKGISAPNNIALEVFSYAAEWYHNVILTLMHMPSFNPDPDWIQERLGSSVDKKTIKQAVERLVRLGLAEEKDGKFSRAQNNLITSQIPSEAIRQYHSQMIVKAQESIESQTMQERILMGTTLTFDKNDLEKVSEILANAHELIRQLAVETDGVDVYQLNTQFFRLTKRQTESEH